MADDCPKCEAGLPAWLATFADLMSLLMCFFVLLLSFATMDAVRFKKMADSMKDAFGVQREIPAAEIVKGVSVIKQEFSPTIAEPSVIEQLKQETSETEQEHLKMNEAELEAQLQAKLEEEAAEQLAELQEALQEQIDQGLVTLEKDDTKVIIRIQEKGSFPSGSASLDPDFFEVMDKISAVLATRSGRIIVAGHTDNVPIRTGRFRSNWELSAARAVTVLHALLRNQDIEEERVLVEGHADTQPLVPNDSRENRAKNRRVELIIVRGKDTEGEVINALATP